MYVCVQDLESQLSSMRAALAEESGRAQRASEQLEAGGVGCAESGAGREADEAWRQQHPGLGGQQQSQRLRLVCVIHRLHLRVLPARCMDTECKACDKGFTNYS